MIFYLITRMQKVGRQVSSRFLGTIAKSATVVEPLLDPSSFSPPGFPGSILFVFPALLVLAGRQDRLWRFTSVYLSFSRKK